MDQEMKAIIIYCSECLAQHRIPMQYVESCWKGEQLETKDQIGFFLSGVLDRWHTEHPEERAEQN